MAGMIVTIENPNMERSSDDQITVADLTVIAVQHIQIAKMVGWHFAPSSTKEPLIDDVARIQTRNALLTVGVQGALSHDCFGCREYVYARAVGRGNA